MFTLPGQIFFCAKNVIVKLMVNCNINCICMPTNMEQKAHNLPFAQFAMFNFQVNYFQSFFSTVDQKISSCSPHMYFHEFLIFRNVSFLYQNTHQSFQKIEIGHSVKLKIVRFVKYWLLVQISHFLTSL